MHLCKKRGVIGEFMEQIGFIGVLDGDGKLNGVGIAAAVGRRDGNQMPIIPQSSEYNVSRGASQ